VGAFFQELFHVGLYKRTQGRVTRQVTFAVVAVALVAAVWGLSQTQMMIDGGPGWLRPSWLAPEIVQYGVSGTLLLAGFWIAYRLVNVPGFADFLIAVEAEMNKVSWPTRSELYRSSIVVLITIFALAIVLFGFDFFWRSFFSWLGILKSAPPA
jgi:preprotein translocase subunit SecE